MGGKIKAPWEGATKEDDALYEATMSLGGAEFEIDVANQMGPYGREAIDWRRAKTLVPYGYPGGKPGKKRDWTLRGFYTPKDFWMSPEEYKEIEHLTGEKLKGDMVYTINPENANNYTWAHEFRHRDIWTKHGAQKMGPHERNNRLFDAYRAQDKDQWRNSVYAWADWLKREKKTKVKYSEAERDLKRELLNHYRDFAEQEALSDWRGVPYEVDTDKYSEEFSKRALKWK